MTPTTARELVSAATSRLAAAGVEGPRFDAELLLAWALDVSRPSLVASLGEHVVETDASRFEGAVVRRAAREPLAYISGMKGFREIELAVDRRVLIPRPETELLVEVVKAVRPSRILDVATGSGAVALALADELPGASVIATDSSPDALDVARSNASRLGLAERVVFIQADLLQSVGSGCGADIGTEADAGLDTGLDTRLDTGLDAIAANLPYVRSGEIEHLQPEIAFEPRGALDGGEDGLDLVRELVRQIREGGSLKPGGLVALEIGDDQGPATATILETAGFEAAEIHRDLTGRDRVVSARQPAQRPSGTDR